MVTGVGVGIFIRAIETTSFLSTRPAGNALFNLGSANEIGIWIYSTQGRCPDLRSTDLRPLVLLLNATDTSKAKLPLGELRTCMEVDLTNASQARITNCSDGYVTIEPRRSEQEMSGTYSIILTDGRRRAGDFRATFCSKSK